MRDTRPSRRLAFATRVALAARIWWWFAMVSAQFRRQPLPQLVAWLGRPPRVRSSKLPAIQLGRYVARRLRLGPYRSTCLVNALVLFRLLREQGDSAELVIGLPVEAADHSAHAWVELDGLDVGPPPGRAHHAGMARFG